MRTGPALQRRSDVPALILSKSIPVPFSGCLLWLGNLTKGGYPTARFDGKEHYLHRYVCEETHGPIPAGYYATHSCDVKCCVEPTHIRPATPSQNNHEAWRRTRPPGTSRGAYYRSLHK